MRQKSGYSADVALTLVVGRRRLTLSHVGPDGFIVRDACSPIPPGKAMLLIKVDDSKKKRLVYLPNGVPGARQLVPFSKTPF